jgi:cytidylate kinase
MEQRFREDHLPDQNFAPKSLPFVTISRETGCSGTEIGSILASKLETIFKSKGRNQTWRVINKEIIYDSAKELNLNPSMIDDIFKAEKKGLIEDMLSSMSRRYYKSDWKIRETIREVIKSFADHGYVIIVGRAGVAITQKFPKSLHIKLHAPQEWRINVVRNKQNLSDNEAREFVKDTDDSRHRLLSDFKCSKSDCYLFDATLNCSALSKEQIADVIIKLMEVKKII